MIARRSILKLLGAASSTAIASPAIGLAADPADQRWKKMLENSYPMGACDWSIRKQQDIAAFDVAQQIGLHGLQVSFSTPGSAFDLRDPKVREQYFEQVDATGIQIASLGMAVLNKMPLASHPESIDWVSDVIDTIAAMKKDYPDDAPSVCLLAFFGKGDINGQPELMNAVVKKLKTVAGKAEDQGVILGIESWMSADDHLKIIEAVGSPAIQVYYDTANSNKMGYDIYDEVVQIGGERICQIHCKENGALLGDGVIDFERFRDSLKKADYHSWLIIEGAMPKGAEVVEAYTKNLLHLAEVFHRPTATF